MSIHPVLRYTDGPAAIAFLTSAFGLTAEQVYTAEDGRVVHAELSWDGDVVMIADRTDPPGPFDTGRATLYLTVDDPDAHHDRAIAAGAQLVRPLEDQSYGSREYAVTDPEGNVWSFGTYRPALRATRP